MRRCEEQKSIVKKNMGFVSSPDSPPGRVPILFKRTQSTTGSAEYRFGDTLRTTQRTVRSRQGRWAHNLWDDGISPWGNTPRWAKAQWLIPSTLLTLERKCWSEYR